MNRFLKLLAIAALASLPLLAQNPPPRLNVSIEQKGSARAQLDYARTLIARIPASAKGQTLHLAVANATGNLTIIERAWPNDRAAIDEANALLVKLYSDANMPQNAFEASKRVPNGVAVDHRVYAGAAKSYERAGNKGDAGAAYAKLIESFDPKRGDLHDNVAALNAAGFFFDKQKQHDRAAAALRHAGALAGLAPTLRVTLRLRTLEQTARTSDTRALAKDLADLRDAHRLALGTSLTPAQREMLDIAEAAIARFEKKAK